jgi:hypothetical protein
MALWHIDLISLQNENIDKEEEALGLGIHVSLI